MIKIVETEAASIDEICTAINKLIKNASGKTIDKFEAHPTSDANAAWLVSAYVRS